jgi:uncharacterized repeat protein (TIGR03837 family)
MNKKRWEMVCRVVDHFGDAGIAWRLAMMLAHDHEIAVTLWIDNLQTLSKLQPSVDPARDVQCCQSIEIRRLTDNTEVPDRACHESDGVITPPRYWTDVILDMFGGGIPDRWADQLSQDFPYEKNQERQAGAPKPTLIVYEYLSAESYVESLHAMPSPPPDFDVPRFFFFPGFTPHSGGLPREKNIMALRDAHQNRPDQKEILWATLFEGKRLPPPDKNALWVSLFCYETPKLLTLLNAWRDTSLPMVLLVPEGVASSTLQSRRAALSNHGQHFSVYTIPFTDQSRYDHLLWACDFNFVRGEDSLTRAIWAGRPFIWQAYLQPDDAHHSKARALIEHYLNDQNDPLWDSWRAVMYWWNGITEDFPKEAMDTLFSQPNALRQHAKRQADTYARISDAATELVGLSGSAKSKKQHFGE